MARTECGVTANILDLGSSDSGFESLHSDTNGFQEKHRRLYL